MVRLKPDPTIARSRLKPDLTIGRSRLKPDPTAARSRLKPDPTIAGRVLVIAALVLASACGYALAGRGNTLPADVRVIGIPDLVNESTEPDIDGVLTRALRTEFQSKGRYVVRPEAAGADAVLTGRVTGVAIQPVAFTAEGQAQRYQVTVTAAIEFRDVRRDQVIWSNPSFQAREEYPITTGASANDPEALFRQDASALERLSRTVARTVVTSIFEAF